MRQAEQKREQELARQKQVEQAQSNSRRMFKNFKDKLKKEISMANKDLDEVERKDSEEQIIKELNGYSTGDEKREQEEEASYINLRKEILRRDTLDTTLFKRADSLISIPDKPPTDYQLEMSKKQSTTSATDNKNEIKKLAYELTDEAIQKEKFFKVVKEVITGALLEKLLTLQDERDKDTNNKYSKTNISNRLAQVKFIQKCKEENVLALPMLNRLTNKKLILKNYRMNDGISKALGEALKELNEYIETLGLESNDISDIALESILKGVLENKYIHTLSIEKNKIEDKSAVIFQELLKEYFEYEGTTSKRISSQLRCLKINNWSARAGTIEILTSSLPDNKTLKELVLSSVKFTSQSTKNISAFISENYNLKSLDLSWSEFKLSELELLIHTIGGVNHIQYLSLAAIPISGPNIPRMISDITSVIRKWLVHLDLSGCNLGDRSLMSIAQGMRQSRTLVAVHLSGNNMSEDIKFRMLQELKKSSTHPVDSLDDIDDETFVTKVRSNKPKHDTKMKLNVHIQKRMNRNFIGQRSEGVKETIDDRIIFTRILGHIEIKDSHMWKLNNICWVWDKWHYTVIIVNKHILDKWMTPSSNFNAAKYKHTITAADKKARAGFMVYSNKPKVAGTFSGWCSREMMPIEDY